MRCLYCDKRAKVTESRQVGKSIVRYRVCENGHKFLTEEKFLREPYWRWEKEKQEVT